MQTERIAVALRPRDGWEAIDLGFRMVRLWWRPLFGAWLPVVWSFAALSCLLLWEFPWAALLLCWWLKPVYDRVVLHVLGEALFGRVPSVMETFKALPGLLRGGLLASLTWLRASPLRAAHLPIGQLEQLRGGARLERARVLIGRDSRVALGLHFVCMNFEWVLCLALLQSLSLLAPDAPASGDLGGLLGAERPGGSVLTLVAYLVSLSLIEPLYIAGGFGLYINRRVYLEGWDIDLAFRRLAARARPAASAPIALALAVLLLPFAARADEAALDCRGEPPQLASGCIEQVLATDEFATTRETSYWWPSGWTPSEEPDEEPAPPSQLWGVVAQLFAGLVRALGWLALLLAAGALLYWISRRAWLIEAPAESVATPEEPLRVDFESQAGLPADVVSVVRARWRSGDAAGALGLLYRAALAYLATDGHLELPSSATEEECARRARGQLEPVLAADFGALARTWQLCAYARQVPADAAFDSLCNEWQPRLETLS